MASSNETHFRTFFQFSYLELDRKFSKMSKNVKNKCKKCDNIPSLMYSMYRNHLLPIIKFQKHLKNI